MSVHLVPLYKHHQVLKEDSTYWSSFRQAVAAYSHNLGSYTSADNRYRLARLQTTVANLSLEVAQSQSDVVKLQHELSQQYETNHELEMQHNEKVEQMETKFHSHVLQSRAVEEAGRRLSAELQHARSDLFRTNEVYRNKVSDLGRTQELMEVEMELLAAERDQAIDRANELEARVSELEAFVERQKNNDVQNTLEHKLAETRLQLALAQSERDEFELACADLNNDSTYPDSSLSSASGYIEEGYTTKGSWYDVDTNIPK